MPTLETFPEAFPMLTTLVFTILGDRPKSFSHSSSTPHCLNRYVTDTLACHATVTPYVTPRLEIAQASGSGSAVIDMVQVTSQLTTFDELSPGMQKMDTR